MSGDIAIIAGTGALAPALAARLPGAPVFALAGHAPDGLAATPFRLERLVPFLSQLRASGLRRVVFAGAVRRPRLDPEAFDPMTATLVPRILAAMGSGDDAALRTLLDLVEEEGLSVCSIAQIAPELLTFPGPIGTPGAADRADAERGRALLAALGPHDLGQGCVIAQGLCLAVETLPGTAAMLAFAGLHAGLRPDPAGARGVFVKAPKSGQDRRIDLPTLGPDSVDQAGAAGLAGIAWQAGGVITIDAPRMAARARAAGLFLWPMD